MAVTATLLTQGNSTTNAASYATASVTPTSGALLLAFISHTALAAPVSLAGTVNSSDAVLFPLVVGWPDGYQGATRARALECWAGYAPAATSGAFTFDFLGSNTQTGACWALVECTGTGLAASTNTAVRNILRGVSWRNGASASHNSRPVTMPNPRAAGNASIFAFMHTSNEVTTPGAGLTELADQTNADAGGFEVSWVNAAVASGTATWATGAAGAGIGVEVAVSGNTTFTANPESVIHA